jgi:SNF2 family DNA or RNA helicase
VYKNLEGLAARIAPFTIRVTKAEALPFLPKKIPYTRYFRLSPEQRRLTNELWEASTTTLLGGETVTVANRLTLYLRLQQIAAGYVPPDIVYDEETQPVAIIDGPNPRMDTALDMVRRWRGEPTIIWTRFQFDIDLLAPALREAGLRVVTYDGRTSTSEREAAKLAFQAGEANLFLGNAAAGGRGLNLQVARHVLFYNNYWGLRKRAQAEDRAHRIGTEYPVTIADVIGESSIDVLIKKARRQNVEVAAIITGDPITDFEEAA